MYGDSDFGGDGGRVGRLGEGIDHIYCTKNKEANKDGRNSLANALAFRWSSHGVAPIGLVRLITERAHVYVL